MLALIAGTGDLPGALVARLAQRPLICAMRGFAPAIDPDLTFRIEHLGSFLADLRARGVTRICMAGAVRRPPVDPALIDAATAPLVPRLQLALTQGDDAALRVIIGIMEELGFAVVAAHDVAPDLLPKAGVLTRKGPSSHHTADAFSGEACVAQMGLADTGQACIVRAGAVLARETAQGTDALLQGLSIPGAPVQQGPDPLGDVLGSAMDWVVDLVGGPVQPQRDNSGAILFKAPKPDQDRRADLPLIGPRTATLAAAADLDGIVIEAGGVLVLELPLVRKILDAAGMFLWVRPRGGA
ncbi:LpxI family protein [Yoonia sp.]|uniref:LpxI family protein n=1 Tax=Yoonia sp. TaxID=2212373 RepID=UPI0019DF535F|nr:UDP-2,3-diacylglucosamine diphosphatase LpxI [Yoonia sp.]MBE0414066.1 UDP-2,3-diacylglucosamine diphosphatase LpxI [Yoonia sp.]